MTIWSDLRLLSRSGGSGNTALLPADREEPENCLTSESSRHIGYRNRIFGFNPPYASYGRYAERFVVSTVFLCLNIVVCHRGTLFGYQQLFKTNFHHKFLEKVFVS